MSGLQLKTRNLRSDFTTSRHNTRSSPIADASFFRPTTRHPKQYERLSAPYGSVSHFTFIAPHDDKANDGELTISFLNLPDHVTITGLSSSQVERVTNHLAKHVR